jgi:hypothetical protein
MIIFDIETTGLDFERDDITVVSCYDSVSGEYHDFSFFEVRKTGTTGDYDTLCKKMTVLFDNADSIAAYNGVRFDIKFIAHYFKIDSSKYLAWLLKCVDLFEMMKIYTEVNFSLNYVAKCNSMDQKISNGREAIKMALSGRYRQLYDYCRKDVEITYQIYRMGVIKVGSYTILGNL